MAKYVVKLVCTLNNGSYSNGSGFICSSEGHVLTCAHNIAHCNQYTVYYKQSLIEAQLIAVDNRCDLALLKFEATTECATFAMIVQYGKCFTYGYHQDHVCLSYQEGSLMTLNYVSNHAIDSTLTTIKGYKGASGSPIFNEKTEVVGIFSYESSIGSGGVVCRLIQNFLQQIKYAKTFVPLLKSHCGYLTQSVGIDDILMNNIPYLKEKVKGERITAVLHAKSKLAVNDIILTVNNNTVGRNSVSIESVVLYMPINTVIKVQYLKFSSKYELHTAQINLIEFPKNYDKPMDDTTILKLNF